MNKRRLERATQAPKARPWMCVSLVACLALTLAGCPQKTNVKDDDEIIPAPAAALRARAQSFNRFLRWRTYSRAKPFVSPALRRNLMLKWVREDPTMRITGFAIRDVTIVKKDKEGVVLIVQNRYRMPSVTLKRVLVQQRWVAKKGIWFYQGDEPTKAKTPAKATSKTAKAPAATSKTPDRKPSSR